MPAEVSLYHFWEVSLSMYIFGALCAWFVPKKVAGSEKGLSTLSPQKSSTDI
jgi:hypothetical protein